MNVIIYNISIINFYRMEELCRLLTTIFHRTGTRVAAAPVRYNLTE